MTTEMAMNPGVAEWLLLDLLKRGDRLVHGEPQGVHFCTAQVSSDSPGWDDKVTETFLRLEENGHAAAVKERGLPSDHVCYVLTDMGHAVHQHTSLDWIRDSLGASPSGQCLEPGDRAMWLWLLRNGGVMGAYATSPESTNANLLHLRVCGLNYDISGTVRDDFWTSWGGTFAENPTVHGVAGRAACRCGLVGCAKRDFRRNGLTRPDGGGPLEVVCEVTSYVELLKAMVTS